MKRLLFFIALCGNLPLESKSFKTAMRGPKVRQEIRELKKNLAYLALSSAFWAASKYGSKQTKNYYVVPVAFDVASIVFMLKTVYNGILVSSSLLSCCYEIINEKLSDGSSRKVIRYRIT